MALGIEEASAKVRTGPPIDDEEDYALPAWAGVIPLTLQAGPPEADPASGGGRAGARLRHRVAAQVVGGTHRPAAGRLHLQQLERAGLASEQQPRVLIA